MKGRKRRTSIISYFLSIIFLLCILLNTSGCTKKVQEFSEEEHIARISERIKERDTNWGYPEGETYEDFEVYPLYNQNDELKYFLVEFEPYGFVFVYIQNEPPILTSFLYANKSMYVLSADLYGKSNPWTPYIRDKNSPTIPSLKEGWEDTRKGDLILDENGKMIIYDKSPYFVTENTNEKKYLLETDCSYEFICAVKKDGKFINLISGLYLDDLRSYNSEEETTLMVRYIAARQFDL